MLEHNHYGDSTWANWISSSKWAVNFSPYLTFTHYLKALQHFFQISKTRLTNQVEGKKLQKIRVLKGIRWLINPVLQQVREWCLNCALLQLIWLSLLLKWPRMHAAIFRLKWLYVEQNKKIPLTQVEKRAEKFPLFDANDTSSLQDILFSKGEALLYFKF